MKKITVISLFLLGALNLITAQEQPFLDVNNPVLHYALNKKDTKYIEVKLLSQINDSNSTSCSKVFELEFASVGKDLMLGTDFSTGKNGLQIRCSNGYGYTIFINEHTLVASGSSETKTLAFVCTKKTEYADIVYGKAVIGHLDLSYDPSEYIAKEKARAEAKRKRLEEEEARVEAERKRLYSSQGIHSRNNAKCDSLLTPPYLANWVGAYFFTKSNIEEELGITPVAFNGGYVMYDFPLCGVTMQFSGRSQVCTELSFRLYGEDGWNMKQQLLNYGYKLQSKSEDLIAENNFGDLQTGTRSVYKVKLNSGDYSTLVLVEGQAFMFTFYRSR